jgi:hypothetical protein
MHARRQCKACPWKRSTKPLQDIPDGYCQQKHANLRRTIATPENNGFVTPFRMMACHEYPVGHEQPCVGWLHNQLGVGNNIALRLRASRTPFGELILDGDQHETFEETIK